MSSHFSKRKLGLLSFALIAAFAVTGSPAMTAAGKVSESRPGRPQVADFGSLPLVFEANRGQAASEVRYLSRGVGYTLLIKDSEVELILRRDGEGNSLRRREDRLAELRIRFKPAGAETAVGGRQKLPGTVHYYLGSDPSKWVSGVPTYAQVAVEEICSGVTAVFYGNQGQLEFDLIVEPGVDPGKIGLQIDGAEETRLDAEGNLVLALQDEELKLRRPTIYQQKGELRSEVPGRFTLSGLGSVHFEVGSYDASEPLVIDPVLAYSSYLGGGDYDEGNGIAADADGQVVVAGETRSMNFPTQSPLAGTYRGGFSDAFVTKFNAAGDGLIYSTYLGGSGDDIGYAVAIDAGGNAYVTGEAEEGFPVTQGSFQTALGGGTDVFVTKLAPDGTLVYSTYIGGGQPDTGRAIDVDPFGHAFVTGEARSTDFPTTAGVVQPTKASSEDAFVAKVTPDGSDLSYSTFLGGDDGDGGYGIAVDSELNTWITGETGSRDPEPFPTTEGALQATYGGGLEDGFVAKLDLLGSQLLYSSYLGGSSSDRGLAIDVDSNNAAYVTGETISGNFPVKDPQQENIGGGADAFVVKFAQDGTQVYGTFYGGGGSEEGSGIRVDGDGNAYVVGETTSANLPAVEPLPEGETQDLVNAFVITLNAAGDQLLFSSGLGGDEDDEANAVALDGTGNVYLTGKTESSDFPVASFQGSFGGGSSDAFVTKIGGVVAVLRKLYFAQFANGALRPLTLSSEITLYNLNEVSDANISVEIRDFFGDPMIIDLNGQVITGRLEDVTIPPNGSTTLATSGTGPLQAGSVTVESDRDVAGVILFRGYGVAGVGASERLRKFRAPMRTGDGLNSGLAFMGLGESQILTLELRDEQGILVATATPGLGARGHLPRFISDFDWDTPPNFSNFAGTVTVTGTADFAATVILQTPDEFATLPVTRLAVP